MINTFNMDCLILHYVKCLSRLNFLQKKQTKTKLHTSYFNQDFMKYIRKNVFFSIHKCSLKLKTALKKTCIKNNMVEFSIS